MKIILQQEARTINNVEISKNEQDLINFVGKIRHLKFRLPNKVSKAKFSS